MQAVGKARAKSALKLAMDTPMAAQIRTMKIKSKAIHLAPAGAKETTSLLVALYRSHGLEKTVAFTLPTSWTVGHLIDRACKHFTLLNTNADPNLPTWRVELFRQGTLLPCLPSEKCSRLAPGSLLVMMQGETVEVTEDFIIDLMLHL